MRFLLLRVLNHSELGFFVEYRRQKLETGKQRGINVDMDVVERVFPTALAGREVPIDMAYVVDGEMVGRQTQLLKRQGKNWRLVGTCIKDKRYAFVRPGALFAMDIDSGRKPAVGAWCVLPADHAATQSIRADAQATRLSETDMIALHGDEASRLRRILSDACPAIFPPSAVGTTIEDAAGPESTGSGSEVIVPDPVRLFDLLARTGYELPEAVADLVDNSITAGAGRIDITFPPSDNGNGRWLTITDDGAGMDRDTLLEAMRVGSRRQYGNGDLGKFGYGLKGASWSQSNRVTVVSKKAGGKTCHLTWDRQHLVKTRSWEALTTPLTAFEKEATTLGGHGTSVLWSNMRPPVRTSAPRGMSPYEQELGALRRHIALVFHRFIEGRARGHAPVQISINSVLVEANNPVGHPLTKSYGGSDVQIPTQSEVPAVAHVQAFVTPTEDVIREHHKTAGDAEITRQLDLISLGGRRNETQGIFAYRCDRLIQWGGWHGMLAIDEKTKLVRLTVDFDKNLDETFEVDIGKRQVIMPPLLKDYLKRDILPEPRAESRQRYRNTRVSSGGAPPAPTRSGKGGPVEPEPLSTPPAGGTPPVRPRAEPSPPLGGDPASSASTGLRIVIREVESDDFLWRVQTGYTSKNVQMNRSDEHLVALVRRVQGDPEALAKLVAFFESHDGDEAHRAWKARLAAGA